MNKEKMLEFLDDEIQHYIKLRDFMLSEVNKKVYADEHNGRIKYCRFLWFLIDKGDFDE